MNKYRSKKERQTIALLKKVSIALVAIIIIVMAISIVTDKVAPETQYTAEQMLHDHDGDGIPDH